MFKKSICLFLLLFAFCVPFSVLAESGVSAYLSDVTTDKNRLFQTYLSVNEEVAAFVATLSFDESKVEFRSAKALSENSEVSVNSSENGKVTLAFLNENGTQGEVLSFTFKAKSENAFIDLSLEQVIDKNANDVFLTKVKGSKITVTSKADYKSDSKNETINAQTAEGTSATDFNESKESLTLGVVDKEGSDALGFVYIALGALLIAGVGVTGFVLGKNSGSKNKDRKN